jgi:hypothetical protein
MAGFCFYLLRDFSIMDRPSLEDGAGPSVEGEEVDEDLGRLAGAHQTVVIVVSVQNHKRSSAQQT